MKILYDYQIFSLQTYGGISRYFFELMNHFIDDPELSFEFPIFFSHNIYLKNAEFSHHITFFPHLKLGFKRKIIKRLNAKNLTRIKQSLQGQDFDVFHPTYYDLYFLDELKNKPFVLTIHDMIPEIYPEMFSKTDTTAHNKKILVERADKIIVVSENSRKDLLQFYDINNEKVKMIYHGCPFSRTEINDVQPGGLKLPEKYLLFVGKRKLYKNFNRFIKAASSLMEADKSLQIICAGGGNFSNEETILLKTLNLEGRIAIYHPSVNETLISLYKHALAFVFPSVYEGFGFPILEAFACGCPVILSHTSSFPEVAGEAGCYFDPLYEESIHNAIKQVIYNDQLKEQLKNKGFKQLQKFSWNKTAAETRDFYKSVPYTRIV